MCYIMTSLLGYFGGKRFCSKKKVLNSRLHIVFIMVIFIVISQAFHTLQCFSNCLEKEHLFHEVSLFCVIKKKSVFCGKAF